MVRSDRGGLNRSIYSSVESDRRYDESWLQTAQAGELDVLQPRDLGHHLANLHIPASSQAVQGSELIKSGTAAEAALLLGGDLLVTVWSVSILNKTSN